MVNGKEWTNNTITNPGEKKSAESGLKPAASRSQFVHVIDRPIVTRIFLFVIFLKKNIPHI